MHGSNDGDSKLNLINFNLDFEEVKNKSSKNEVKEQVKKNLGINLYYYKSASKSFASVGEIIEYSIFLENKQNVEIYNTRIQANIPAGTSYIESSLMLNDRFISNVYMQTGIMIRVIKAREKIVINFKVKVNKGIPVPEELSIFSTIFLANGDVFNTNYVFTKIKEGKSLRNNERVKVIENELDLSKKYFELLNDENTYDGYNPNLYIEKKSSVEKAKLGDSVRYYIYLINDGNVNLENVKIVDLLDDTVSFVGNSFKVNCNTICFDDFKNIINLGPLLVGEECRIEYLVKVIKTNSKGVSNSKVYGQYEYRAYDGTIQQGMSRVEYCSFKIKTQSFYYLELNKILELKNACGIDTVDDIDLNIVIDNQYSIFTHEGENNEQRIITGKRLKFYGYIDVILEYTSTEKGSEIRSDVWKILFSSYIELPKEFNCTERTKIFSKVEYSTIDILNSKKINLGTSILFFI